MKLFNTSLGTEKNNLNPLIYPTPLGDVFFNLVINEKKIKNFKPLKTIFFQKTIVSSWSMEECEIEFLQTHFKPQIPPSMQVETCLAGIWRVRSLSEKLLPIFKVILDANSSLESNGIPESGEGMISVTFENAEMQLSIGTEDEDYLNNRAIVNQWMPSHFSENIFNNAIETLPNGIKVVIPYLKKKDCIQIQFIIAWSSKKNHKDSCWFAVDQPSDYILKEAGVL